MKIIDFLDHVSDINCVLTDDRVPFIVILDLQESHSIISKKLNIGVTPLNITPENSITFLKQNSQNLSKENFHKLEGLTFKSLSVQINDRKRKNIVQEYIDRMVDLCVENNLKFQLIRNKGLNLNITLFITKK